MTSFDHLSIVDGAFLHLERAEMPMHVGSLALYEPPETAEPAGWLGSVRAHIAARLHLAPVFTRKLAPLPLEIANPLWITESDVDLKHHIRHHLLPAPGTIEQLEALAAQLHAGLLDRSRPLWEFHVIEGLADGRLGLYSKLHHAAVDGQAAVALAGVVFDTTPDARPLKPRRRQRRPAAQPAIGDLLTATLSNQWLQLRRFAGLLPPLASAALAGVRAAAQVRSPQTEQSPGSSSRLKLAPQTPFNAPVGSQRVFAGVALPLEQLKVVGRAHGASINDIVIWLCSTALREHLLEDGALPERSLVAGVPISLRAADDSRNNNQVSMTLVDLASELADPWQRLAAITGSTRRMKGEIGRFGKLLPQDFPSLGAPWLLGGLAAMFGRTGLAGKLRIANLVISNVPGPQQPMYLAGAKLSVMYPLSIVVHGIGLNITVQSYLGQLCVGLLACRRALPDIRRLAEHFEHAFEVAAGLPLPPAAATATAPRKSSREAAEPADRSAAPAKPRARPTPAKTAASKKKPRAAPTKKAAAAKKPRRPRGERSG
ncbi:WS/DGAT/MGAT family O-acyltransferase [Piscinibacter sakaiensis]|uniref:WS/DGAT/MGAT family O-acyltransferase n=1 Tax=Piscinibacter sakaiensis TaxID=1547922 RepID=UPI003AABA711